MPDTFDHATGSATGLKQHVRDIIDYDDARESAPQEHAATLLGAGAFALCALRAQTRVGAVLHAMVAGALLFRAASGRDGLRRWAGAPSARPAEPAHRDAAAQASDWRTSAPLSSDPDPAGIGAP
ncbi:hypothetical protein [Pseudorhodoferax soli]|uniref:Uncharacterized protein n=1 Tax=Pseudorhodoferax soli TaxID=545864 RepID=A0A368YET8_9BURK|nr:hypothetical protein [Pseudorhodoferax soli]RCW76694.1 hypothetical protein DES41_1011303 [Pseudorhodoferax soli]